MAVAAFHLSRLLGLPRYLGNPVFSAFTRRGSLGVDFFFVLSGFIILYAHHRDIGRPRRVVDYLLKRFVRLFPIYWLYTAAFCSLVIAGFGSHSIVPETFGNWISTIFLVRLDNFELPITPGWTLIHELAFYLVFATLVFNRRFGSVVLVVWLALCAVVFQYADEGGRQPLTTYFSPLSFNFLTGMGAFYLWSKFNSAIVRTAFPAGVALFVAVYVLESNSVPYSELQLAYAASFGLLIAGAAAFESCGFVASRFRLLSLIGDASYSIYLTHLAFLGVYCKVFIKISGVVEMNSRILYMVTFAATIVSGCLCFIFVERPLLRLCRRKLSGRQDKDRVRESEGIAPV